MVARWFHIEDYYERDGDKCVFYPSLYSPGYRFTPDDQAQMDGFLGPFLSGRLRLEFIAILCIVTFSITIAASGYLFFASNDEIDAILAVPPWVWLAVAAGLPGGDHEALPLRVLPVLT